MASLSSISKAPSNNNMTITESPEESGWTKYFDDFFNNDNNIHDQKCSISFSGGGVDHGSSSLVPDHVAAAKKLADQSAQTGEEYLNTSIFRKRNKKIKTTLVDDDLEDTASSPINSPKVLYENQLYYKANENEELDLYQEKGNTLGERDERKKLGFNERDSDSTELKKKGFCLVPLSMVMNYLG